MTDRNTNLSQHPATPFTRLMVSREDYEKTLMAIGEMFDAVCLEEAYELLPEEDMPSEEAARAIAAEMYVAALQREIATPCEANERERLLRDWRIATKQRAEAHDKMSAAARDYHHQAFDAYRSERNYLDQTLSILRGKLRDQFGITRPDLQDGGAL